MTLKGSANVTITLRRTTVEILRSRKRGTAWDDYLLEATNRKCGVECMNCGRWLAANRTDTSQDILARDNGWKPMVIYGEKTVGFLCDECAKVK